MYYTFIAACKINLGGIWMFDAFMYRHHAIALRDVPEWSLLGVNFAASRVIAMSLHANTGVRWGI